MSHLPGVRLATTPQLLTLFDEKLPGHAYQTSFPASLLSDSSLGLQNLQGLLHGSKIVFPPKPARQSDPAHAARMAELRRRMEERDYQDMIAADSHSSLAETRDDLKVLKNQISTIINVLISIFTAAMAAWFWTSHLKIGSRVLAALAASIGLGAVETFLYLRYLKKIEQSESFEASKKGKSIIKRRTIEDSEKKNK